MMYSIQSESFFWVDEYFITSNQLSSLTSAKHHPTVIQRVFKLKRNFNILYISPLILPTYFLVQPYFVVSTSSFPPTCLVVRGHRNSHRWFFSIVFCHPPSSFPSTLSSVFFFFRVASYLLSAFRHVQVVVF